MRSLSSSERYLGTYEPALDVGRLVRSLLVVVAISAGVGFVAGINGLIRASGFTEPHTVVLLHHGLWSVCLSLMLLSFEAGRRPAADPEDIRNLAIPSALMLALDLVLVILQLSGPAGAHLVDALAGLLLGSSSA